MEPAVMANEFVTQRTQILSLVSSSDGGSPSLNQLTTVPAANKADAPKLPALATFRYPSQIPNKGLLNIQSVGRVRFPTILFCMLLSILGLRLQLNSQEPKLVAPSLSVAPAIVSADSGVKSSGAGNHWSDWYPLGAGKAPQGYTVRKVEFWLTGDRRCGEVAECRQVQSSDQQVLWEFRLQGNETDGVAKIATSEGHIRVTYRPR